MHQFKSKFKLLAEHRVVVLTGAGISAESGIRTFRDNNGLWEDHNVEDVATPEGFLRNPELVWKFYKERYAQLSTVKPNPGHYALVRLEEAMQDRFCLVTQNIDGLHIDAGTKRIYEMHGKLRECFCVNCNQYFRMKEIDLSMKVPECPSCGDFLRPDVVWFGEIPYHLPEIEQKLIKTDYLLVVGTSGVVYPAAGFAAIAKMRGAKIIGINLEEPENAHIFNEFYKGKSGDILPELVAHWLE
ncbi:MAG TPA: NAD-dependent deacylase [Candidatus Cloacimonadota bacterium]|mgnify:CR=1 FL=1|nr:NAD-dependent deacylase [Candidatus Cloacimonadota bacterium]HPT72703.1 NAD-dependent deacylase [Candidatus Cloacimonadota bacterium]